MLESSDMGQPLLTTPAAPPFRPDSKPPLLYRIAPGLSAILRYRFKADFPHDLVAGLSVAAVALPVAIAYAELAGFSPEVGLYSCILPLIAYAIFGTSRQLMVNPDAAVCAMIAASVGPLAAGNSDNHLSLSIALTFFTGLLCIVASFCRLGAMADFLSKPILVGFLNGIAISIFLGQIGKLCGFSIAAEGIVPRFLEIFSKLSQIHWATLLVGLGTFAILFGSRQFIPRAPAALVAMACTGVLVAVFKLDQYGVAILGRVPSGLPALRWPIPSLDVVPVLIDNAAGLALVLFSSGMLTARSFASKNQYDIDVDKEFAAFGMANIASALSGGFAVTGADSRTAMGDSAGGRTQVTGIVAAATIAVVLMLFTEPLKYVPIAALGAVLIFAAFSLFDILTLRQIWPIDRAEVVLSIITTLGVVAVGAIHAILIAVALALARFVKMAARPHDEVLGLVEGLPGYHSVERHSGATTYPGLVMYRFGSPITFFNCAYFKRRLLSAADAAGPTLRWIIVDAIPISHLDVTGLYVVRDLHKSLLDRGVNLVFAGRRTEYLNWLRKTGQYREEHDQMMLSTLEEALEVFQAGSWTRLHTAS